MIIDDRWIFVNYVPGSFGSFIAKVIETSPSVAGNADVDIFDDTGASHKNVSKWITNFHHGDDLDKWYSYNLDDQLNHVGKNIVPVSKKHLYRVHRLTVPKYHSQFVKTFVNAKFIKIIFDDDIKHVIAKQFCEKTFDVWYNRVENKDPTLYRILSKVNIKEKKKYYLRQCKQRIDDIKDSTSDKRTMLFDIEDLLKGQETFNKVFNFLEITPGNYKTIYNNFLTLHEGIL